MLVENLISILFTTFVFRWRIYHIKMSMCMYAVVHSSKLDYPLLMSRVAHCLPRDQTWAGYTTRTVVYSIYTQHYNITLWLLL